MEGDGGDNERGEKEEVPRLKGKELKFFPFLHRGGGGSPVRTAGDRGLVSSLTQRDSSGQEKGKIGSEGGDFYGGEREKEKVNKK